MFAFYQLQPKHPLKIPLQLFLHFSHADLPAQFFFDGRDLLVLYAAGDDMVEITQIGIHVERKAMHSDPAAAAHTHGTDLPLAAFYGAVNPHARFAR